MSSHQSLSNWRWSDISAAITPGPPASQTTCEVSNISDTSNHSPNATHAFSAPVGAFHMHSEAKAEALDSAASKISIDTASTVPDAVNQALNVSHISASASLNVLGESMPACTEGRLIPPPFLLWFRSRLALEGERSGSTILAVAWWQPILMRVLPLTAKSTVMNYRLHRKPSTSYSKSVSWWLGISTKNPSTDQINRACGDYRLVYLRTIDILTVGELNSSLRQHWLYRRHCILAMFPFAPDIWEILVARDYANRFIEGAEACGHTVEESIRPGSPVGQPSDLWSPFESCLGARERLIARASIAQLASGDNKLTSSAAIIYRDLVKLYRCYDVYGNVVSTLLTIDQPAYSPGWSCTIGFSQYPTNHAGIRDTRGDIKCS